MTIRMTRREFAIATGAAVLAPPALAQSDALPTRAIPSSGERLPAVGLGTAQVFNTNDEATRQKAAAVLQALGLKLGAIALVMLPVAAGWLILSAALGRTQERRAALMDAAAVQGEQA